MRTRTRYPRLLAAILALAVLVRLPALVAPPVLDDHVQAAMAAGEYPSPRAWWDYYAFARGAPEDRARLRAEGTLPWWTAEDYQLVMFRPLSSALVAFDQRVLRHWALARLHSLGWMLAYVAAVAALLRRRAGDGVALGAAALLALDDALTTPLAWHANRCGFVALALATYAVSAAVRYLDEGARRDGARALGLAALSCLAGEYAWTMLPAAAVYARLTASARRRAVYLALLGLALGYAALRGAAGAGVRSCVLYPDLTRDLGLLFFLVPRWWTAMLGDLLAGAGVEQRDPWLGLVASRGWIALSGAALVFLAWRRARLDARGAVSLRWALYAGVASIAVVSTAWLSSRLMLGAGAWSAALVAMLSAWAWRDPVGRVAVLALLVAHGPWKAAQTWRAAARYRLAAQQPWDRARTLLPEDFGADASRGRDERVFVLNAVDPEEVYFGRYTRRARGLSVPGGWYVLASTMAEVHVYRESARSLSIVSPRTVLDGVTARFFRSGVAWPSAGSRFEVGGALVEVVTLGPYGPTRVRVTFDRDLDDPGLILLVSRREGLQRFTAPAVNASARLAPPTLGAAGPR